MDEALKIFLGVLVSLAASCLDALGLNIQKRDHLRAAVSTKPRHECLRFNWHLGLYLYCGSQIIGSTLALQLLKAQWAAPLGAISLVFNFIFARFLVGTIINRRDIIGTLVILAAILMIVLMGAFFGPQDDIESDLDLKVLKALFEPIHFKVYFASLNVLAFGTFIFGCYTKWFLESGWELGSSYIFYKFDRATLVRLFGIGISAVGGTFASETLILAKSGFKLIIGAFADPASFTDPVSIVIVIALVVTAVLQIYCLNSGLKYADSVVAVPVFACAYNVFAISNSMIYLNQFDAYPWWVHLTTVIGVMTLIGGIVILSMQQKVQPECVPKLKARMPQFKNFSSLSFSARSQSSTTNLYTKSKLQEEKPKPQGSTAISNFHRMDIDEDQATLSSTSSIASPSPVIPKSSLGKN